MRRIHLALAAAALSLLAVAPAQAALPKLVATDGPGFAVDEPMDQLGDKLVLPPFLEGRRAQIEAGLKPL